MAHFCEERNLNSALIIGCGDIGRRVAALCQARGAAVSALTRNPDTLAAYGVTAYVGDLDQPAALPSLPSAGAALFYFAPPPADGIDEPRLRNFLHHIAGAAPAKLIYISTSGVYGDCGGAWVSERTPARPGTDRARRRYAAELLLRDWERENGVPAVILRVGGIYGPGRLPLERLRRGAPVLRKEDCGHTNRIHADDLAAVCLAAAEHGTAGALYNVSDGHPSSMTDYFNQVAARWGLPPPPEIGMAEARERLSAEMMSYLNESRRMDNRKMLVELGVRLRYPTLADGLAAIPVDA